MKKAVITLMISISLILGIFVAEFFINSDFKDVDTVLVSASTLEDYIELTGDVKEVNKREIKYDFPVKISELFVSVGDEVNAGQKLASLDKTSLLNQFEMAKANSSNRDAYENLIAVLKYSPDSIVSPIKGVVSEVSVSVNSEIKTDTPLIVITDTENLVIRSKISNDDFREIRLGQKAYIYSGENLQEGKISKIYPTAEKEEGKSLSWISFEIEPENPSSLTCGTAVEVKICSEIYKDIVTVPFDAIMFDEAYPYVFVDISGYAVKKRVVLGKEFETTVEVKSGLSVDDKLITSPKKIKLRNGDKLSGEEK